MRATKRQRHTGSGHQGGPDPRVVAVEYRPAPDAEARLRRIAAILLEHATRAGSQAGGGERPEVR